jgi:outer membrane murein-binding lipoprotein Lpp
MSGKRNTWGVVLALALAGAALSCGASNAGPDADLAEQVQALTKRIEALEREVASLKSRGAAPSAQLEQEAQSALTEITRLVGAGNVTEAKAKLGDFQK